jgi:hypothetical protein
MAYRDYSSVSVLEDIIFTTADNLWTMASYISRFKSMQLLFMENSRSRVCELSHELRHYLIINCSYFKNRKCQPSSVKYKYHCRGIKGALTLQ